MGHDVGQLARAPVAHADLVRCRMWNLQPSCCTPSMESPQQLAFDDRRAQLGRKVGLLKDYLDELNKLRSSKVFALSDQKEQALLDRVLIDFRSALTLVPACVRTLITFVAGMVCFGCNPRWDDYV